MSLVRFNTNGEAIFIYEDGHPSLGLGKAETKRASHVEPNELGYWVADLYPVGGPQLPESKERTQALNSEAKWLDENIIASSREAF